MPSTRSDYRHESRK